MSADNSAWDRISSRQREKLFGRFKPTLNATRHRRMAHDASLWSDFPLSFITPTCPVQSGFLRSHTRAGNLVIGGDDSEPTSPNHALQRTPGFGVQLPRAAVIRPAQSRAVLPAMKPGTARAFASRRSAPMRVPGPESLSLGSLGVLRPLFRE